MKKILTNCTVVDVRKGVNAADQTIEIEAGKIAAITTGRAAGDAIEGAETIDGAGAFVVPGLIDMHVHIGYRPDDVFPKATVGQATAGIRAARNLQTATLTGITTVRDLGTARPAVFETKAAWDRGEIRGRVLSSPDRSWPPSMAATWSTRH